LDSDWAYATQENFEPRRWAVVTGLEGSLFLESACHGRENEHEMQQAKGKSGGAEDG